MLSAFLVGLHWWHRAMVPAPASPAKIEPRDRATHPSQSSPPRTEPTRIDAAPAAPPAAPRTVESMLRFTKAQADDLFRRHPGLHEKMLAGYRVAYALEYAEFFAQQGIVDEQANQVLDLLAAILDAPNRGELGEAETAELRRVLGDEKYAAMRAYDKISPGLRRGDAVVAMLRDQNIALGESEAAVRAAAAQTVRDDDEILRRVYERRSLSEGEEQNLRQRAFARYEPLRRAVLEAQGQAALAALDRWIQTKTDAELLRTKKILTGKY